MLMELFRKTGMLYVPALCLLALYAVWGGADLSQDVYSLSMANRSIRHPN